MFIDNGADFRTVDANNWTPLYHPVINGIELNCFLNIELFIDFDFFEKINKIMLLLLKRCYEMELMHRLAIRSA